MKKILSYALVAVSLLGITTGAMVSTNAKETKAEITKEICNSANTSANRQDICSALNSCDLENLLEKYGCSLDGVQNVISPLCGNTKSDCNNNSVNQSKDNCATNNKDINNACDNNTTVTQNTDENCTTENNVFVTESQEKNCISDYVEKAKELVANKTQVKAEDVKKFCDSVNKSVYKKDICSALNSSELKSLLEKFGCSLDKNQNTTTPPVENTEPTDKKEPATENNSSNNSGNQNQNNSATEDKNESSVSDYEKRVVELVNEIRVENGLSPLTLNSKLSNVARLKSQDMKDKNYFSHTSPTYGSPFDMMKQFGISYRSAGENIAMGYATPEAVVNGWMNSPGHRANILNSSFKQIGVGYVAGGNYWTQMFIG